MKDKPLDQQPPDNSKPFIGALTAVDAANAIRAARLTAMELFDTAEILYSLKRFTHSAALSTLSIEEAAKPPLLLQIFLGSSEKQVKLWKSYRNHHAKTAGLNPAIASRVRATFPETSQEEAQRVAEAGPTSNELERWKQRAIYSDCLDVAGNFVAHCPTAAEWRQQAWERLCEAQTLCLAMRDYPPGELELWKKHMQEAEGKPLSSIMPALHKELLEKGFIQEGWWNNILKDFGGDNAQQSEEAITEEEAGGDIPVQP